MAEYPVPYNGTETGTGGDSMTEDLNIWYSVSNHNSPYTESRVISANLSQSGDIAWVVTSTALVLLMIPGVGYGRPFIFVE